MRAVNRQFEWYLLEETGSNDDGEDLFDQQSSASKGGDDENGKRSRQYLRLYELILGIALLYGVAVYLLWQRADQRMAMLEEEIIALQPALANIQDGMASEERPDGPAVRGRTSLLSDEQPLRGVLRNKAVKPQWQPLIRALESYVHHELTGSVDWQRDDGYLTRRQLALQRSIDLVLQQEPSSDNDMLERMQHPPIADEVADPLIEFIVESYGYATTLALVEALGRYENWEEVAPEVFQLSAEELEVTWHEYLDMKYAD